MLLVVVGDSISATRDGWTGRFAAQVGARVLNLAVAGGEVHTSSPGQLARLPESADIATLYFGSNDVRRNWNPAAFETSLSHAAERLARIVGTLIMPTVPLTIRPWPVNAGLNAKRANASIRRIADAVSAQVVALDLVNPFAYWTADLVHPRSAGHELIARKAVAACSGRSIADA